MTERRPIDLGTTIAGIRFPFSAMNAAGAWSSTASELRALARSATGAIVLKTATLHPFVHPAYRSLQNPGYDKLLPLVRELAAQAPCPVVASIAGTTADEYANLARAFGDPGAVGGARRPARAAREARRQRDGARRGEAARADRRPLPRPRRRAGRGRHPRRGRAQRLRRPREAPPGGRRGPRADRGRRHPDRKSTRLNS